MRAFREPFSFSSSILSLLADTKAISIPEKKAIRRSAIKIANSSIGNEK
jgi:hypothetical protein